MFLTSTLLIPSLVLNVHVAFTLAGMAPCGLLIDFTLTVNVANGDGPQVFTFRVQTGEPSATVISYTGPPVPIPANLATTINKWNVSAIGKLTKLIRKDRPGKIC
jgi:hypothetical protein